MNDLEDRLRSTLHNMANDVPASQHARADLDRRLAGRGRRRPLLVAAAAAVVVAAGVAVPVALNRGDGPSGQGVATQPTSVTQTSTTSPLPSSLHVIGSFEEDGVHKSVALSVDEGNPGDTWCAVEVVPRGQKASREPNCFMVPISWPERSFVLPYGLFNEDDLPNSGPVPNLMVFVTSPQVTTLEVSAGTGGSVSVTKVVARPGATFYVATFPGTSDGWAYTAKDAAGNVLASAIT